MTCEERGIALKKKGQWGKGLGRLFAGPDESARTPSERSRSKAEQGFDADEIETPEDILAKYGKYLDEDGVPFKGINPKPKYYVVPKEHPLEAEPVEEPLSPAKPIVHQIKTSPAPPPEPEPRKVIVRKRAPKKVVVRKRARPEPPVPKAKKIVVKKAAKPVKVKIKVKR